MNVTEDTLIFDNNGNLITIEDLQQEQMVKVIIKEKTDIKESKRDVTAMEIKVLN